MANMHISWTILFLILIKTNDAFRDFIFPDEPQPCRNPNGHLGVCISINECEPLKYVLRKQFAASYEFVRRCECKRSAGKYPFVCCTRDTQFIDESEELRQRVVFPNEFNKIQAGHSNIADRIHYPSSTETDATTSFVTTPTTKAIAKPIKMSSKFPQPPFCGAVVVTNKIFGGNETELNEFSWMTVFEYRTERGILKLDCAGSIINERYVLTVAHCVVGEIEKKNGKLESVRIGEHNTATDNDCNKDGCIPQFERYGIEKVIVHEQYGTNRVKFSYESNDIALIRLNRAIVFNMFLQPVCLPNVEPMEELRKGASLMVAGWGHTGFSKRSAAKQKVKVPLVTLAACREAFVKYSTITEKQLCAGGVFYEDSCAGDSGGPLMRFSKNFNWILEGIVSFGLKSCGLEGQPSVYTRVRSYLDWIDDNVQM